MDNSFYNDLREMITTATEHIGSDKLVRQQTGRDQLAVIMATVLVDIAQSLDAMVPN